MRHTDSNTEHLSENLAKLSKELRIQEQQEHLTTGHTRSTSNRNLHFADNDSDTDDQPRRRRSSTISGSQDVHREMTAVEQDNKMNSNKFKKVDQNRKNQLHSASFTSSKTGNFEMTTNSMRNKSESLPPKSPLFKIFNQISQNKSSNTSDENLGANSSSPSSSCSSNLNISNNNSINLVSNQSTNGLIGLDKEKLNQLNEQLTNPISSILKQPNKQPIKQHSLEKTIEFLTPVTLITDSNEQQEIDINDIEEKDIIYDENGNAYRIEKDDEFEDNNKISWRKQIFSRIHSKARQLEFSNNNEMKSATKNVTFDSDLFKSGKRKRTREEYRELWRKAIQQQIVLVKMEKENRLLQGKFNSCTNREY